MEFRAKARKLKVLVIDEEIPYPPDAGKRIRTWNLLKRLATKHAVHLLCYGAPGDSAAMGLRSAGVVLHLVQPMRRLAGPALYFRLILNLLSRYPFSVQKHYSSRFQKSLNDLLKNENWDLVQCEWTPYARFIASTNVPTLITTHNIESQVWGRRARNSPRWFEKVFFGLQEKKMMQFECEALVRARAVTVVTSADAATVRKWGVKAVTVIPNGVDLEFYQGPQNAGNEGQILSIASLDWFPNVDALDYFAKDIFPRIRERIPRVTFRIVGRKPSAVLREKFERVPGIEVVGEVQDVRPYLEQAAVIVVPLRIGGGSRLKILEALAAGKAVVSTSIGAEGLELEGERDLLIADSPEEFARRTVELLSSSQARRCLGERGRAHVTDTFSWDGIAEGLENVWFNTAHPADRRPAPTQ